MGSDRPHFPCLLPKAWFLWGWLWAQDRSGRGVVGERGEGRDYDSSSYKATSYAVGN